MNVRRRVLIADDEQDMRLLLRLLLQQRFDVVGEAADGAETVELAHDLQPDVVVLDWRMPGLSGAEALTAIVAVAPRSRVIVFSASLETWEAIEQGADAFVSKSAPLTMLAREIDRLAEPAPPR